MSYSKRISGIMLASMLSSQVQAANYFVTTDAAPTGPGTFAQALTDAEADPGLSNVLFFYGAAPFTSTPNSPLSFTVNPAGTGTAVVNSIVGSQPIAINLNTFNLTIQPETRTPFVAGPVGYYFAYANNDTDSGVSVGPLADNVVINPLWTGGFTNAADVYFLVDGPVGSAALNTLRPIGSSLTAQAAAISIIGNTEVNTTDRFLKADLSNVTITGTDVPFFAIGDLREADLTNTVINLRAKVNNTNTPSIVFDSNSIQEDQGFFGIGNIGTDDDGVNFNLKNTHITLEGYRAFFAGAVINFDGATINFTNTTGSATAANADRILFLINPFDGTALTGTINMVNTTITAPNTRISVNTTVGGIMNIGNGTIIQGAGDGCIALNGTLTLNPVTPGDAAKAVISIPIKNAAGGTGSILKTGAGWAELTATNTYSGGTIIQNGTLAGGPMSFGSGGVQINGGSTLEINQGGTLSNVLTGAGTFNKAGPNDITVTGDSSAFTGPINVLQGNFILSSTGRTGSGLVTVGSNGSAQGTGIVGGNLVNRGTLSGGAGNTLRVSGNLIQDASGRLVATFSATDTALGASDVLNVGGDATVNGSIQVTPTGSGFQSGTRYRILTAGGTLTQGASLTILPSNGMISFILSSESDGQNLFVEVVRNSFETVIPKKAQNGAAVSVGDVFGAAEDQFPPASLIGQQIGVVSVVLDGLSGDGLVTALNQMSPLQSSSGSNTAGQVMNGVQDAVGGRSNIVGLCDDGDCSPDAPGANSFAAFANYGRRPNIDTKKALMAAHKIQVHNKSEYLSFDNVLETIADGNAPVDMHKKSAGVGAWAQTVGGRRNKANVGAFAGSKDRFGGVITGVDAKVGASSIIGIAISAVRAKMTLKQGLGRLILNSYTGTLYGNTKKGLMYANGSAAFGVTRHRSDRHIPFMGTTARNRHPSTELSGRGEVGAKFTVASLIGLRPHIGATVTRIQNNAYTEKGANVLNLNVRKHTTTLVNTEMGVSVGTKIDVGGTTLVPSTRLTWTRSKSHGKNVRSSFALMPAAGTFSAGIDKKVQNILSPLVSLAATLPNKWTFNTYYKADFSKDISGHQVGLKASIPLA